MGFIFILSITGVVLLAKYLPDSNLGHGDNLYIEDGDTAKIHYKLWIDDDRDSFIDIDVPPYQESTLDFSITKDGLINGFYYESLDLEIGEIAKFLIDPNIDADGDGDDDITGDEILGYGAPSHALFNMTIYYWIQVVNITKSEENIPASSIDIIDLPVQMENFSENYLICNVRHLFSFEFLEKY